ncbi:MAG: sulfite exporter TauE/SafE family protein [Alphaproteobacteria bacterium]|nr:sulfite exporter TauE/SafE family protein [Alphaproteobacteria bacterium]
MNPIVLVFAGASSGAVTGLTGGSGVSVLLSILLLAGFDVHAVIGVCLATQVLTMSTALLPQARAEGLPWLLVPVLCLPAVPCSWLGARLALRLPGSVLEAIVAAALLVIGGMLLRTRKERAPREAQAHGAGRLGAVGLVGGLSGLVAGLFGGGGNVVVANALHALLGMPFRRAVALSLCLGVVSTATGVLPYLQAGRVDLSLAPWVLIPGVIAAPLVSRWATRIPVAVVRRSQGAYLVLVAAVLAARLVGGA